jgi:nucleoside-diphosphate-sugar epimerase
VARVKSGVEGYQSMNIGWGVQTSFNELALMAARIADYTPTLVDLEDKPFGVMHRYCDPKLMLTYYPEPKVTLEQGIKRMLGASEGV